MPDAAAPRVCFVNLGAGAVLLDGHDDQPVGGEEVQHALLARALARQGWSTSLVTHDLGQGRQAQAEGIELQACYPPVSGWPGLRFLHPRWTGLHDALRRADADVYYVSCAGSLVGQVAWFTALQRRRMVFRVASDSDCEPQRVLVATARERWLYHRGLRAAHAVLAQSAPQLQALRQHHGIEAELAPMWVDVPAAEPPPSGRDVDVLWVANLRALKRPELFVELARSLPGHRFHLVGGPVAREPEVARRVTQQAAAAPNLILHGRLGYRQALALFERARVFVSTSRVEGFPNTFLQAWAHGVPSVSYFDPDGVVQREGLGLRVDDEQALASAVSALLADPQRHGAAAAACRRHMLRTYRADTLLGPYESTFRRLAGTAAGPVAATPFAR